MLICLHLICVVSKSRYPVLGIFLVCTVLVVLSIKSQLIAKPVNISAWLFSETAKCCIFVFVQLSIFVHNIRDSVKVIETYGNKLIAGLKSTGTFFVFIIPMLTLSAANHWFDAVFFYFRP
jgi:hypothetical protein